MSKNIVCYECFGDFADKDIEFRCARTPKDYEDPCILVEDVRTGELITRAFPYRRSRFGRLPRIAKCSVCGTDTNIRVCPRCHQPLLHFAGETEEYIIAIVGSPEAGKKHYFTVLIEECLSRFIARDFGIFAAPADPKTILKYEQDYKGFLYTNKREIPPSFADDRCRLVFRMSFSQKGFMKRKVNKIATLVFYEIITPYYDLMTIDRETVLRYLWNSSGIIYLANPLHFSSIRAFITSNGVAQPIHTQQAILSSFTQVLRRNNEIIPGKKIDIPLAVCLSQSDRLMEIEHPLDRFPERIFMPHRHLGKFDAKDFKFIDTGIRDKLNQNIGHGFVNQITANFKKVGFFAVSALGASPENGRIPGVNPIRCEDPFLWILSELGIIKKV